MSGTGAIIFSAPASGSGKTVITMGAIAAWRRRGMRVAAAKAGPDYIDTAFLSAAAGAPAVNLDPWAMRRGLLHSLVQACADDADLLAIEGVMGLFDGAAGGAGSTAELARALGAPVVLVVDAGRQGQSVAALAHGFRSFDAGIDVAGVILNRVAGGRHERLLRAALEAAGIAVLGAVPRHRAIALPSRHLGLVQAGESEALGRTIDEAARLVGSHVDLDRLAALALAPARGSVESGGGVAPPGQRIALASDQAFGFVYEHVLAGWRREGAEIHPFSPLADEAPDPAATAVVLPGGYPELHAGRLAAARVFLDGLAGAARRGATIHGECGGYMVLGEGLVDGKGARHRMAGLLGLETSFAARMLSLGYRRAIALADQAFAAPGTVFRGHEFHHATVLSEHGRPLFAVSDVEGHDLGHSGLAAGRVAGSFVHLIDVEAG